MSTLHLRALKVALDELIALGTPTLAFMATSYTPNSGTQEYWSDISASQAAGTNDIVLTNVSINIDTANGRVEFDCDDVSDTGITTTTDQFTIRVDTGNDATSPVLLSGDIAEGTLTPVAGTLALTFNAEGVFGVKAAAS